MSVSTFEISAVIITYNEEDNIRRCLESLVDIATEIIVVDSFSTDRTKAICEEYDVKFFEHDFEGHVEQKNYAASLASHDYILSLDADECLSDELKSSIMNIKNGQVQPAYSFNRLTNYCGTWIRYCGWYPDTKIRLWNKHAGHWGGLNPHDKIILNDNIRPTHLKGDLLHYSYKSIDQHLDQIKFFSTIGSKAALQNGKRSNLFKVIFAPVFKFIKDYILRLGILDGYHGYVVCRMGAIAKFMKYHKLLLLQKGEASTK